MTLARRAFGKYSNGALAITVYRAGAWLWFWEPLHQTADREVLRQEER